MIKIYDYECCLFLLLDPSHVWSMASCTREEDLNEGRLTCAQIDSGPKINQLDCRPSAICQQGQARVRQRVTEETKGESAANQGRLSQRLIKEESMS